MQLLYSTLRLKFSCFYNSIPSPAPSRSRCSRRPLGFYAGAKKKKIARVAPISCLEAVIKPGAWESWKKPTGSTTTTTTDAAGRLHSLLTKTDCPAEARVGREGNRENTTGSRAAATQREKSKRGRETTFEGAGNLSLFEAENLSVSLLLRLDSQQRWKFGMCWERRSAMRCGSRGTSGPAPAWRPRA